MPDHPLLANGRVLYVGHPVAVVVAETPYAARDAAAMVEVDIEPREAVVDVEAALAPGAPRVYEELDSNVCLHVPAPNPEADKLFEQADQTLSIRLLNQRVAPFPMEGRAICAHWEEGPGKLTIWTSNQAPHSVKQQIAMCLGIPEIRIRAIAPEVGGGFGAKIPTYAEDALLCWVSRDLMRPVKWAENADREPARHDARPGSRREDRRRVPDRWPCPRPQGADDLRDRRLPLFLRSLHRSLDAHHVLRLLRHQGGGLGNVLGLHEHDGDGGLPRRRPARGRLHHRTRDGRGGGSHRPRPGRGAAPELHQQGRLPSHHSFGRHLRHRRLREAAGPSDRTRGLRRSAGGAAKRTGGRPAGRNRARHVHRGLRSRPLDRRHSAAAHGHLGKRDRAGRADGQRHRLHGRLAARPGPGDRVRPNGGGRFRRRPRRRGRGPRRHGSGAARRRYLRQPRHRGRRRGARHGAGQGPREGDPDRRPSPRRARRPDRVRGRRVHRQRHGSHSDLPRGRREGPPLERQRPGRGARTRGGRPL